MLNSYTHFRYIMRDKSRQFNFTIAYIIIKMLCVASKILRYVVLKNYEAYKHERES